MLASLKALVALPYYTVLIGVYLVKALFQTGSDDLDELD